MTDPEVDNREPREAAMQRPGRAALAASAGLLAAFVAIGALVAFAWVPLLAADLGTDLRVHTLVLGDRALLAAAVGVTNAGGPLSVDLITGLVVVGLLIRRRPRAAVYLVAARLLELGLETATKHLIARPRPVLPQPVAHAGGFSYPSGHTAGTSVLCVALLVLALPVLKPRWRAPWIVIAALAIIAVAASRILLGVHYPSDVLGAALLGTACALVFTPLLPAGQTSAPRRDNSGPPGPDGSP